jgi:hypothetical protein
MQRIRLAYRDIVLFILAAGRNCGGWGEFENNPVSDEDNNKLQNIHLAMPAQ